MLLLFLRDQKTWLLFFVVLISWINILFYLDEGLNSLSILYVNLTSIFLLLLFVSYKYFHLKNQLKKQAFNNYDAPSIIKLFEREFDNLLQDTEQTKNMLSVRFQEQSDEQIHWIHEIKTPLTAQKLMIDTMSTSKKKQQLELEWLRIHLLLDQTLHTLRVASLEQDLILQQVAIKDVITEEIKSLQSWFIAQDLAIEIEELAGEVFSDRKWLQIISRQLLTNAIKYSDKGSTITINSGVDRNGHRYLEISDEGYGIAPQDIPRIFQRGFTGTIGRKQSASTGMGLYLVKTIANKLKINIQVNSTLNIGTTIRLYFPLPNKLDDIQVK